MSGKLHLILGRADTGKTARVVAALKAHQNAGEHAILLVPEQYTYEAERLLADALGGLVEIGYAVGDLIGAGGDAIEIAGGIFDALP